MDDNQRYPKGDSAGSKGAEFQVSLLTVFALNALKKLDQWKLSTENKQAGKFDDAVLETPNGSVLLQAKFRKRDDKTITLKDLTSNGSGKDSFSLPKYYFSYREIKIKYPLTSVIICTNANLKLDGNLLRKETVTSDSMLHYQDGCFFYRFNKEILPQLKDSIINYYKTKLINRKVVISDEAIEEFLGNLQFHSNYPSEKKLNQVIEQLFSSVDYSKNLWYKTCSKYIYLKVMDWFQQEKGTFLTEAQVKALFCEIRSYKYCEELEKYNLSFERNNYNFQGQENIYYIITQDYYLIDVIKVFCSIQNVSKTENLFVNPGDNTEDLMQAVESFQLPQYCFLVLIWPKLSNEDKISVICDKIRNILRDFKYKKVILVAGTHNKFAQNVALCSSCQRTESSTILRDFSVNTQTQLLKQKIIVFQNKHVSLEKLLRECESVDAEILEKLVKAEEIRVGSEVKALDDDVSLYYIPRILKRKFSTSCLEEHLCMLDEKVILIANSAGMGKSTLLTRLAMIMKDKFPYQWVIKIELNDYTRVLSDCLKQNRRTINLMDLLQSKDITNLSNHLEKIVFSQENKIILLVDGVDEISPNYTNLIVSLLVDCKDAQNIAKVFVTTRPHVTTNLELDLQVKPFSLAPLTEQNQTDFLVSYWMHNLKLNGERKWKCVQYAEKLKKKMMAWVNWKEGTDNYSKNRYRRYRYSYINGNSEENEYFPTRLPHQYKKYNQEKNYLERGPYRLFDEMKENYFTAVPLQVRMMAETFQENTKFGEAVDWEGCKEYLNSDTEEPKLPDKMNISRLYGMFIEKKRDVFLEKLNPSGNPAANDALNEQFDQCLACHKLWALEEILDINECEYFSCYKQNKESVKRNVLRISIIHERDGNFYFTHRTFAEYFIAESILDELQKDNAEFLQFFIDELLLDQAFKTIRGFLDSFLQMRVNYLSSNVFNNYKHLKFEIKRQKSYPHIHQLASEGHVAILKFLFECMRFQLVVDNEIDVTSHHYILETGNTFNILQNFVQIAGVNLRNENGQTPLLLAIEKTQPEMVLFLIENGANMEYQDVDGFTPLQRAIDGNHFEIVNFLLDHGVDVTTKDASNNSPLLRAISCKHKSIVSIILDSILSRYGMNPEDSSVPFAAAYLGRKDLLETLFEKGTDVNCTIENGETLVFAALRGKEWITVLYLKKQGADINRQRKDGDSPLFFSLREGHCPSIKFLVDRCGADVDIKDASGQTAIEFCGRNHHPYIVQCLVNSLNTKE